MTEPEQPATKAPPPGERARQVERREAERLAGRTLDAAATEAITVALTLAPQVADAASAEASERVIEVKLASVSEANFVRKRVNAALSIGEWLDDVAVWVWLADTHKRAPLSEQGRQLGFELRMEQATKRSV